MMLELSEQRFVATTIMRVELLSRYPEQHRAAVAARFLTIAGLGNILATALNDINNIMDVTWGPLKIADISTEGGGAAMRPNFVQMLTRDLCTVQRLRADDSFYKEQLAKALCVNPQQIVIIAPEVTDEDGYLMPRYKSFLQEKASTRGICPPPRLDEALLLQLDEATGNSTSSKSTSPQPGPAPAPRPAPGPAPVPAPGPRPVPAPAPSPVPVPLPLPMMNFAPSPGGPLVFPAQVPAPAPIHQKETNRPWIALFAVGFITPTGWQAKEVGQRLLAMVNKPHGFFHRLFPLTLSRKPGLAYPAFDFSVQSKRDEVRLPEPEDVAQRLGPIQSTEDVRAHLMQEALKQQAQANAEIGAGMNVQRALKLEEKRIQSAMDEFSKLAVGSDLPEVWPPELYRLDGRSPYGPWSPGGPIKDTGQGPSVDHFR